MTISGNINFAHLSTKYVYNYNVFSKLILEIKRDND